jgi:dTDP-4-dehydrorhamnose reductase
MTPQFNLLITGSNGQLAQELFQIQSNYPYNFNFVDREQLDIQDTNALEEICFEKQINVIINTAAYTAVDLAEDEKEKCQAINASCLKGMSEVCHEYNIHLIHYSTDYVFDGTSKNPYTEENLKNPISYYGQTKSEGEDIIQKKARSYTIIRTSWVYSQFGKNFVKTMLKLAKDRDELSIVADQIGSPTYAADLAEFTLKNLNSLIDDKQLLHYTNEAEISWADFAEEIFNLANLKCSVKKIPTSSYPTKAARPLYSVLSKKKINDLYDIKMNNWKESLKTCLKKMGNL